MPGSVKLSNSQKGGWQKLELANLRFVLVTLYRGFSRHGMHFVPTPCWIFFCMARYRKNREKNNKICFNFLLILFEHVKLAVSE